MAVTRIKNNQITDSTITYQKIAPGTLVGSLFNANLTLNSNISIAGNLTVSGNTTTVNSIDTLVSDSLITLNNGYVGVPAYDVGILFNRALGTLGTYGGVNAALVWSESDGAFLAVLTTETGTTAGTINRAFRANLIAGNITAANAITAERATITNLNATNTTLSGLTSTGNIVAASGQNATNYTTGALVVPGGGGVGITGDLWVQGPSTFAGNIVAGNIQLSGNINVPVGGTFSNTGVFFGNAGGIGALYAGTTTYTALPTTVLQLSGNVNTYAQVNFQNINSGTKASTDFVLTADNGNDTDGFLDLGINSSTFNDISYPGFYPNDGYLIHHSALSTGNLIVFSHTEGSAIKFHVGEYGDANVKVTVTNNGLRVNTTTTSTSTTSGALIVSGGAGIAGNLNVGGTINAASASFASINNTPIGNATPSTGAFTYLTATTGFSTGNAVITGGYIQSLANIFASDGTIGNINTTQGNVTTLVAANFSTGNAVITGGSVNNSPIGNTNPSTGNFTTANATTFTGYTATIGAVNTTNGNINTLTADTSTTTTLNTTSANATTLVSTNFSSGNAQIASGYADNFPIGANTASTGNFTTANANTFSGYTATIGTVNSTTGNITTGNINTLNTTTGNITTLTSTTVNADTSTTTTLNTTSANATTLVSTNFSSGNSRITGGYIDATPIGPNIASTGNFTTANAKTVDAYTVNGTQLNATNGNITTLVIANFSTGNAVINGGNININTNPSYTTTGFVLANELQSYKTLSANVFSTYISTTGGDITANLISSSVNFTGGLIDNTPIGNTTPASGAFSSLSSSQDYTAFANIIVNASTNSISPFTGALTVAGGVGIGGNLYIAGNLTVQGNTTVLNTETLNVEDLNIIVAANALTSAAADGAGLTVNGANATFTYVNALDSWQLNKNLYGIDTTMVNANVTTANLTSASIGTLTVTNPVTFSNLNVTNGNITTLVATNFSSGNSRITGGYADDFPVGANTAAPGNFTTANATTFTGYTATIGTVNSTTGNITNGLIGTLVSTNFSSGNTQISGGYADNLPIGANTPAPGNFTTVNTAIVLSYAVTSTVLNVNSGNITTLVANNFSSGNSRITGGYADNFPVGANVAAPGNFTTANATTLTSYDATITTLNSTTGNIATLTSTTVNAGTTTSAVINSTTGNITTLTSTTVNAETATAATLNSSLANVTVGNINTLNSAAGNITTLVANNFSSGNSRITGGYADNFPIGANVAAPGSFTQVIVSGETKTATLNATSNVYLSPQSGASTVTINPLTPGNMDNMTIGATSAANVYASNFRAATSLWAATTGPVWIRGGTGTSGINNIPIGAVTPSTGAFTVADIQTGNITTLNNFAGNITTLVATNFSSGNAVISGGYISALTNAYVTTGLVTNFSTANARITGGYADNFPVGANTAATGAFTTLTAAALNNTIIGNATPAAGTFTALTATGNLTLGTGNVVIASGNTTVYTAAAGTANTTGALVITGTGGAAINGNMYVGQGVVINGNQTSFDTIIRGVNERSLLYVAADSVYDQVSVGGNITTANIVQGAKLVINSKDAMLLPVGTTAERPSGLGYTDVEGMIRYNSTTGEIEYYGGGQWNNTGSTFTVIQSRTFSNSSGDLNGNVDGINTTFTLLADSTTAATLVSINGVIQIPDLAYSVLGNVCTFTEAPAIGDVIDTRVITTTSTLAGLASLDGYNQFAADTNGLRFFTGNLSLGTVENWRLDTWGDFIPLVSSNIGAPTKRVDYLYVGNINVGGAITGATLSSGSLDDTVIGGNIARPGNFTLLYADSTFTTNAEHVTDDVRGKFVAPSATDAVYGFATATYRSAKFFVQLSNEGGSEYQSAEVIMVHNDTTPKIEVYGVTYTGAANLATFSSNIAGGIAYLNASSAGANLRIKVTPTLMKK